jgi:ABC-type glycerol-3-phosphate transport system substrate-binding protein
MVKKKLWVFVCVLILMFAMTACSNNEETSNEGEDGELRGTITVWIHPFVGEELKDKQNEVFHNMAKTFNEKHPNVKIKFEEIPWANREQKILTALASNQGPDVFYLIPDMMAQFAEQGVLTPITELLGDDWDKEDFPQTSLDAVTYKGEIYGLPILREVLTYFYNTKILKEIGGDPNHLPTTWEEFNALAEKAVEKGYYARGFEGANTPNATIYPLIWQAGGDIIDENGNVVINKPEAVEAFKQVNEWYQKGWIPKDSVNSLDHFTPFVEGKSLTAWGTGLTMSTLRERGFKDYVVGPPLKHREQATFGTTGMFVVASNSKNKRAAAEFIKHMTSTEHMKAFNELTKYIPPRKSAASIYDNDPQMKQLTEYLEYTKPGVIHPVARTIIPKVQAEIQAMLEGKKSPQQAANDAAKAIKEEIEKGN